MQARTQDKRATTAQAAGAARRPDLQGPGGAAAARDAFSGYVKGLSGAGAGAAAGAAGASAGRPLSAAVRGQMEAAFQQDFSTVRVHEDAAAARAHGGQAFAQGEEIFVAPGQAEDARLIAHELTHVVQQRGGRVSGPQGKNAPAVTDAALETEADAAAERVVSGRSAGVAGGGAPVRGDAPAQGYRIRRNGPVDDAKGEEAKAAWKGLPGDMRVAEDGTLAVLHAAPPDTKGVANPKALFATDELLRAAAETLVANGSPYRLDPGGEVAEGPAPDGSGVQQLVSVRMTNLEDKGASTTPRNCDENTRTVMGVQRPKDKEAPGRFGVVEGKGTTPMRGLDNVTGVANRVRDEMAETDGKGKVADKTEGVARYSQLTPEQKSEAARTKGVNQHVAPERGDGLTVVGESGKAHFAGVVATAGGGDYVTLENDAAQSGPTLGNPNWYFRMYGSVKVDELGREDASQTFWGEQAQTGWYDQQTIVLRLKRREADDTDEKIELLNEFSSKAGVQLGPLGRVDDVMREIDARNAATCLDVWIQMLEHKLKDLQAQPMPKAKRAKKGQIDPVRKRQLDEESLQKRIDALTKLRPLAQHLQDKFGQPPKARAPEPDEE